MLKRAELLRVFHLCEELQNLNDFLWDRYGDALLDIYMDEAWKAEFSRDRKALKEAMSESKHG